MLTGFRSARRAAFKGRKQGGAEHGAEVQGFSQSCVGICATVEGEQGLIEALVGEKLLLPTHLEYVPLLHLPPHPTNFLADHNPLFYTGPTPQ